MPKKQQQDEAAYLDRRRRESLASALGAKTTGAYRAHQEMAREYQRRMTKAEKSESG